MTLALIDTALRQQERDIERRTGEATRVARDLQRVRTESEALIARSDALDKAIGILNAFADERQADLQQKIEALITHGLRTIFGPEMSFHVVPTMKGKIAAMEFVVRTVDSAGVVTETPVMDARGGGVAAVAGFLLRLIVLLLRKDTRRVLLLDEAFGQLSEEYEPALAEFIRELVDRTPDVQIILVTHSVGYADVADITYRLALVDGRTKITRG